MGIQIYGNLDAASLETGKVQSIDNLSLSDMRNLVVGDSVDLEIFLTSQTGFVDIQNFSTRIAIGEINAKPTSGTWDLGSQTGLAYNIGDTALGVAIKAATSGNPDNTTTELSPFVFKTVFDNNGSQTTPSIDATGLTPSSSVSITKLVEGDGSTKEQWLTRIFANPLTLQDTFTNITKDGVGNGIAGALSINTPEIFDQFSATITSFTSTLELEITSTAGDVTTIFQVPVTIGNEVIGAGITVSTLSPSNFVTASEVNTTIDSVTSSPNSLFVSADRGNDATGTRNSTTKPYATISGAYADTQAGDTIFVVDGDFSSASTLTITKDLIFVLNGVLGTTKVGALSSSAKLTLIGNGVRNEFGDITCSNILQAQNVFIGGTLTLSGTSNGRVDNCVLAGGSSPSLIMSGATFHQLYFKDSIISSSGDNSVFCNEAGVSAFFDNCLVGSFAATGHNVFEIDNATNAPILFFKDSVLSPALSSDNPFNKSSSATTIDIEFVGGATEISYFTNQSDFTIDGNYVLNSRSTRLPYVIPA